MAAALEPPPQLPEVVDLAVARGVDGLVLVGQGLVAPLEVDDRQPPEAQGNATGLDELTRVVGTPVRERARHPLEDLRVGGHSPGPSGDAAHEPNHNRGPAGGNRYGGGPLSGSGAPKLILVSPGTENELFPRVARARALAPELQKSWQVEMVQGPRAGETPTTAGQRARARVERRLARQIALDEYEVRSRRRFGRWRPNGDLALLVVWPYSASVAAARRLEPARIPYVIDAGDPWVLTAVDGSGGGLAHRRQVAAERRLWKGAAGAILTTARQEAALRELFPNLPTLVQPSGYREVDVSRTARRWLPGQPLELGHFGALYRPRIDFVPLLGRMTAAGPWQELVLHQFGAVASELPDRLPRGV